MTRRWLHTNLALRGKPFGYARYDKDLELFPSEIPDNLSAEDAVAGGGGGVEPGELTVTGISPSTVSTAGGDEITITGTGFTDPMACAIGGNGCSTYFDSSTQIRVIAVALSAGSYDVEVIRVTDSELVTVTNGVTYEEGGGTPLASLRGQLGIFVAPETGDTVVTAPGPIRMVDDGVHALALAAGIPDPELWIDLDDDTHRFDGGSNINSVLDRAGPLTEASDWRKRQYLWAYGDQPWVDYVGNNRIAAHFDAAGFGIGAIRGVVGDRDTWSHFHNQRSTLIAALRWEDDGASNGLFIQSGNGAPRLNLEFGEGSSDCYIITDGAPLVAFVSMPSMGEDWFVVAARSDPANTDFNERLQVVVNGVDTYDGNTYEDSPTPGPSGGDFSFGGSGWVGEILGWDYRLTDAEREAVEAYLMTKWSVT